MLWVQFDRNNSCCASTFKVIKSHITFMPDRSSSHCTEFCGIYVVTPYKILQVTLHVILKHTKLPRFHATLVCTLAIKLLCSYNYIFIEYVRSTVSYVINFPYSKKPASKLLLITIVLDWFAAPNVSPILQHLFCTP